MSTHPCNIPVATFQHLIETVREFDGANHPRCLNLIARAWKMYNKGDQYHSNALEILLCAAGASGVLACLSGVISEKKLDDLMDKMKGGD